MNQGYVHLDHLEIFVLDEADRMLDMGFIHDVKKVIRALPVQKQTMLFSATMPPQIAKLVASLLHTPVKVEVAPVSSTAERIEQFVYFIPKQKKQSLLVHLLNEKNIQRTLVFTRTKHGADRIAKDLKKASIHADAIHGNKSQSARQNALNNFKRGKLKVLVATDIAARGIDVDALEHVINFDLPDVAETYVHRIGRTGRAGANGIAISFCDGREEMSNLKSINKLIGTKIPAVAHPFENALS
jgi:ATP-dependent RNA helicase RhlE